MARWTETLAALLLLGGCTVDATRIRPKALARALAEDPGRYALVDVRSEGEWRASTGHLAGAQHLAWPGVKEQAAAIAVEPGQTIVLICLTGHRSQWAKDAVQTAWPDVPVMDLRGGMAAWWASRLGVVREGRTEEPAEP